MGLMDGWSICDRCGWKARRRNLRKEATGFVVCNSCYDGAYDLLRHPQNKPYRPRRELLPIPDGRPMDNPPVATVVLEDLGGFLLTESGEILEISPTDEWTPESSVYIRVAN